MKAKPSASCRRELAAPNDHQKSIVTGASQLDEVIVRAIAIAPAERSEGPRAMLANARAVRGSLPMWTDVPVAHRRLAPPTVTSMSRSWDGAGCAFSVRHDETKAAVGSYGARWLCR